MVLNRGWKDGARAGMPRGARRSAGHRWRLMTRTLVLAYLEKKGLLKCSRAEHDQNRYELTEEGQRRLKAQAAA